MMARQIFVDKNFRAAGLAKLELVNNILDEYEAQGFDLSLRQVYYQMVARGHIENSNRSYKNLGNLVNDGRLAGMVDWDMIVDRGRVTITPPHWRSPAAIVRAAANGFAIDKWATQDCHIEVMVEKDALSGVLEPVCRKLDIRFTANKGYPSSSILYGMSKRLIEQAELGKEIWIMHLGDHDPSGIDMTRDLIDRLGLFTWEQTSMEIDRLALNMNQVRSLNPPENPAKTTDSRYQAYLVEFGDASWELDAIEPTELARIVTDAVEGMRDQDAWDRAVERESKMKAELMEFADSYKGGA
jgi:hypothetical protein